MRHVPGASIVSVDPLAVQTAGVSDWKLTGNAEEAVALSVNGVAESRRSARGANVIVCAALAMTIVNGCTASGAVPSDAVIDPVNEPAAVGVPEIAPAEEIERPGGSPVALKTIGAVPLAVATNEYEDPNVPPGGGPLVICGGCGLMLNDPLTVGAAR